MLQSSTFPIITHLHDPLHPSHSIPLYSSALLCTLCTPTHPSTSLHTLCTPPLCIPLHPTPPQPLHPSTPSAPSPPLCTLCTPLHSTHHTPPHSSPLLHTPTPLCIPLCPQTLYSPLHSLNPFTPSAPLQILCIPPHFSTPNLSAPLYTLYPLCTPPHASAPSAAHYSKPPPFHTAPQSFTPSAPSVNILIG